jgi:diguanylate cyclase (GGDEF)-like protein/PAS domain S-box-containing protein
LLGRDHERAGRFRVLYQPCVSLAGSRPENALAPDAAARAPLRGFEALLRWQHPRLGNVPPDEFIGIAEACGLIEAIGDWVLQEVIDQLAAWRGLWGGMAQPDWRIAVNVSPLQLTRPGFSADLMDKLAAHGLPPQCLTLEVTEGVFADQRASDMLAGFRKAGIKIAVDDFGVGYSSLSYLRHLPADELKLDRSFLQRNDGGPLHEDMLGALVQLARAVGFSVLAEGVETEEHLTAVAAAGCDAAQGWLFAKALPPAEAAQWIVQANPNALPDQAKPRMPFSFRDIVAAVNEAVIVTAVDHDEGGPGIVYVNPAFTRMTGWPLVDILGKPTRFLRGPETDVKVIEEFWNTLRMGQPAHARVVSYARSGMSFWCEMRAAPLRDQHGEITHYVAIARDVSHEMCRLDDLETLVERDTLTGIANSLGLEKFAAGLTAEDRRLLCVAYIDIDGFKTINATLGNAAGDAVLLGMADIICQNIRRADFVGRIGDDQFVICMPCQPLAEARQVAERLRRAISVHAFETPAGPVRVPCSLGVAAAHRADHGLTDAIARARVALCKARSSGRGALVEDLAVPG